jgi:(S)-2-hydroxyglutarate dehydrogenase
LEIVKIELLNFDIIVIGAGIVGLATAYKLLEQNPKLKICVIEKETKIAQHQTGHNSGVIHSGIYYKPNSLKAINCQKGYQQLIDFCEQHGVKYDLCGKVIVATKPEERQSLDNIYKRGVENGLVGIKKITAQEVKEIEPHVQCVEGIWVPQTGIIDYKDVSAKYAVLIQEKGGTIFLGEKVLNIINKNNIAIVTTDKQEISTKVVINCCGLYSDKIAKLTNRELDLQIIPFRGEYYELKKEKEYLVKNLIYPVPNPDFPFLGVHYTRMIHGGIEAGPNAVLAFKREGYSRWDINLKELYETLTFSGFQKVATKYWDEGWSEMKRSYSKALFVKALQTLIPEIQADDVVRSGAGVRAQACDGQGNLLDDFSIIENENVINVCNAPSPAATSSLAIGNTIALKAIQRLNV